MEERIEIKQEILDMSGGLDDDNEIEFDVPEYINIETQIPMENTLNITSHNKKENTLKVNNATQKDGIVNVNKESGEVKPKSKRSRYKPDPKTCNVCGQQLSCTKSLNLHMRIHNDEKPFKCEICGKMFRQISGMRSHMVTHSKEKPFPCPNCDGSFTTASSLKRHIKRIHDSGKRFDCKCCPEIFYNMASFNAHKIEKHPELWEPRDCPDCGIILLTQRMFSKHCRVAHLKKPLREPSNNKRCILCGQEFNTIKLYMEHKNTHLQYTKDEIRNFGLEKIYPCKMCDSIFSSLQNIVAHVATHLEKTHECKSCNQIFTFYLYRRHMKEIHDEITCQVCKEVFLGKRALHTHKVEKHFALTQCQFCKKILSTTSSLRIHTKRVHKTDIVNSMNNYECIYCHGVFVKKGILQRHILHFHANMLKKSCDICKIQFKFYYELHKHIQNHHAKLIKRRRQHQCNICNKSFTDYSSLRAHKTKLHRNKKCEICYNELLNKKGFSEQLLKKTCKHKIVDTPIECNQCSKNFSTNHNFKRHLLVHSIKDRTCRICHSDFEHTGTLEDHFLADHPDEKIYHCEYCNVELSSFSDMIKHRRLQNHMKKFRSFLRVHWQLFMKPRIAKNTHTIAATSGNLIKQEPDVVKIEPTEDFGDGNKREIVDLQIKQEPCIS